MKSTKGNKWTTDDSAEESTDHQKLLLNTEYKSNCFSESQPLKSVHTALCLDSSKSIT